MDWDELVIDAPYETLSIPQGSPQKLVALYSKAVYAKDSSK